MANEKAVNDREYAEQLKAILRRRRMEKNVYGCMQKVIRSYVFRLDESPVKWAGAKPERDAISLAGDACEGLREEKILEDKI